jgi:hypothetical protein
VSAALRDAHDWLDAYRELWEKRFDRIDVLLESAKHQESGRASKRRHPKR